VLKCVHKNVEEHLRDIGYEEGMFRILRKDNGKNVQVL
jgi:hypothetical protein